MDGAPQPEPAWLPKSVLALRGYTLRTATADVIAGLTVGLVALPLAMAFAIASGLPPQSGIYCAIVTGFIISALGGSRVQIGGPTGAFVVVVSGIVVQHGVDGLFMCTMMAGVLLMGMGISGMGAAVRFIPRPVVVGFTNGIAVLIASTQIPDVLGLRIESAPGAFVPRIAAILDHLPSYSGASVAVAAAALLTILLVGRSTRRVPGSIVALVGGTAAVALIGLPVETVGSRFGAIPAGLPDVVIPRFQPHLIEALLMPAVTVAMLGAIESLMSAMVADRMSGDRHNPNMELIAQGAANVLSPLVGGLPATGAIARTATNIRSGARTPVAGMVHAVTLLVILLAAAPLAGTIPLAVLGAILLVVAYNMGEWHEIPELLKLTKTDVAVWLATFGLTVLVDLTVAVEVGMVLAALLFIRRISETTTVAEVTEDYVRDGYDHILQDKSIPPYVTIFRIHGPFLFGTTDKIDVVTDRLPALTPIVVLRLRNMTALDATGLRALEATYDAVRASGRTMLFCGLRDQPGRMLRRSGFHEYVGEENVCENIARALERARQITRDQAPLRSAEAS